MINESFCALNHIPRVIFFPRDLGLLGIGDIFVIRLLSVCVYAILLRVLLPSSEKFCWPSGLNSCSIPNFEANFVYVTVSLVSYTSTAK